MTTDIDLAKNAAALLNGAQHEGKTIRAYAIAGWLYAETTIGVYNGFHATTEVSIPYSDVGPMPRLARGADSSLGRTVLARIGVRS